MILASLPSPSSLLAVATESVGMSQYLSFVVTGFLFVVVVLSILSSVTWLIGLGFRNAPAAKPTPTTANQPVEDSKPAVPDTATGPYQDHEIPEHIPVVLAAAAHTVLQGKPHRIVSIRNVNQRWAQEGRREIFSSHKLR